MNGKEESTRKRLLWIVVAGCAVVATALVWILVGALENIAPTPPDMSSESATPSAPVAAAPSPEPASAPAARPGALAPADVIDNPDCVLREGRGAAVGLAAVALPKAGGGSRFSVIGRDGALFGGDLPFRPNHLRLGRRPDGAVLAAFADLRLNQVGNRPQGTPEPVRVYLDGASIYENDRVRDFDVAADGSSFFAIEPLAGDASRLVVHSLDLRAESHFDLEGLFTSSNAFERPYAARYGVDHAEVMFEPSYADAYGRGTHWFFPVDGGPRWSIRVEGGPFDPASDVREALFASGREGYFVHSAPDGLLVSKSEFRPVAGGVESEEAWARTIDLHGDGDVMLSDDGAWLGAGSRNFHVLDARTGRTAFAFPTAENLSRRIPPDLKRLSYAVQPGGPRFGLKKHLYDAAALARLSSVMEPGAGPADVGSVSSVSFRDGRLLMYRRVRVGEGPYDFRHMFDAFELDGIRMDSPPDFRVAIDPSRRCGAGDFYTQGLQVHGGQLTYLTAGR